MRNETKTNRAPLEPPENQMLPETEALLMSEDAEDLAELQQLLANEELTGGNCEVYRKRATDVRYNYLDTLPVKQFGMEAIKRLFGGGDYRVKLKRQNGQFFRSFNFAIDPMFKGSLETIGAPPAPALAVPAGLDTEKLILALNQGQKDFTPLIITLLDSQQKMTLAMMQSFAQVMSAALSRSGTGLDENLSSVVVETLKNSRPSTIDDLVKLTRLQRELTGGGNGEPEEKNDLFDKLITLGGPLLAGLLARPGHSAAPVLPAPAPAASPESSAPDPIMVMNALQKMMVRRLLQAAQKNEDPELWADTVETLIPEEWREQFFGLLRQENWLAILFEQNQPEARAVLPWLTQLRQLLLQPAEPEAPENPGDS